MVHVRRIPVLCVCALLSGQPAGAEAGASAEGADLDSPSPAVVALRSAASATASDVASSAAALPGRAQLGGERLLDAAAAPLADLLPDALLDGARRARDRAQRWHATAGTSVRLAAALRERLAQGGGLVATADRALDAAAAVTLGGIALVWAADARRRRAAARAH